MTLTLKQLIKLGVVTPIRRRRYRARKQIMRDNRNTGDYIPPVVRSVSEMRGSSNIISPNQGSAAFLPYTDVMRIRDEQQQQFIRQQEQKRDLEAQRIALEDYQQEQQGRFQKAGEAFKYVFSRLPSWENDTYGNFGEVGGSDTFQFRGTGGLPDTSERVQEIKQIWNEPTTQLTEDEILSLQSPQETSYVGAGGGKPFRKGSPRTPFEKAFPSQAVGGGMAVPEESEVSGGGEVIRQSNVKPSDVAEKEKAKKVKSQKIRSVLEFGEEGEMIEIPKGLTSISTTKKNYKEIGENPDELKGMDEIQAFNQYVNVLKGKLSTVQGLRDKIDTYTPIQLKNEYLKRKRQQEETIARSNVEYISAPKPSPKPSR